MAYASFHNGEKERPVNNVVNEPGFNQAKALGKVYGYMGIGLLITAVVCVLVSWLFSSHINEVLALGDKGAVTGWVIALISTWAVSALGVIILSIVIPVQASFGKGNLWITYILFAIFMGALLSAVLMAPGVDFYIVGEALGVTTLMFAGMAIIGWTSKKDLSIWMFIAFALLMGILLFSILGFITLMLHGWSWNQYFWFDIGIQAAVIAVLLIVTMVDTWRIKKILMASGQCENMYLYGAFVMYSDFISILIRVIYILSKFKRN